MWLAPDFANILPELKAVDNWVLAKGIIRPNGKIDKPPYQTSGFPASHSDPSTWSSFSAVEKAYLAGGYIGVGFVLDGKPHFNGAYLHGFDWDDCIENGRVDPDVKSTIKELGIPRIEVSVSGTGLRGFFLLSERLPSRRTRIGGRSVELYSSHRYMTTTGRGKGDLR